MNNRLINTKVAGGGGGCTDIVDNYDPFDGGGLALYQLNGDANDVSGNYNGTASNVTYGTGVFGQAGVFNNNSSYVSMTNPIASATSYTISAWINRTGDGQNNIAAVYNTTDSSRKFIFRVDETTNKLRLVTYTGSGTAGAVISNATINTNTWYNVIAIVDGGTISIYINGSFDNQTTGLSNSNTSSTEDLNIGRRNDMVPSNYYFGGSIDQVRIFNTALTPLEVEALYTEELCICDGTVDTLQVLGDTSCIATYQLDGNANDLSGNYSGTPTDVSYGVGEFDLAGVFNGSSKIALPSGTAPFDDSDTIKAISCWVKLNTTTSRVFPFSVSSTTFSNDYFTIQLRGDALGAGIFVRNGSTSNQSDNYTNSLIDTNWHHYVFTLDGTRKIYIDGQEVSTTFTNVGTGTSSSWIGYPDYNTAYKYNIGIFREDSPIYSDGSIDQVRIFNKALNQAEVTTLFDESACTYGGRQSEGTQILGDSSCIAYYKLDGTAEDETGNYDGTFITPNYANGEFDLAGVFNGSSSKIVLPSGSPFNDSNTIKSISCWIKYTGSINFPFSISSSSSLGYFFYVYYNETNLVIATRNGTSGNQASHTANWTSDGNWHHIVFQNSTENEIYLDGVKQTLTFVNTGSATNSSWISYPTYGTPIGNIGVSRVVSPAYGQGEIDQMRLFNKALNQSEVTTLYNEGL